jgi:hypothetical protein
VGKIKNTEGSEMCVGLEAVLLQYRFYVFGHLSKWFVFVLMFKFWSVSCLWNGRPNIGYNVFGLGVRAGFGAQSFNLLLKLIRSTKLQVCTSARLTQNPC